MSYAATIDIKSNPANNMFGLVSKSDIELAIIRADEAARQSRIKNYPARQARLVQLVEEAAAARPQMQHGSAQSANDPKPAG